jgi:hypothetical protein
MNQSISSIFESNWSKMEEMSKRILKDRWREGISSYYIHLSDRNKIPQNIFVNFYYFLVNLSKPQSEINYTPVTLRKSIYDDGIVSELYGSIKVDVETEMMLKIDLGDDTLIDFLLNNHNNDKWIKLYKIFYEKKIELDLFEEVVFDYIFKQGLSIRQIAKMTDNHPSWIYRYRKSLLDKIKAALNEN